MTNVYTFKTYQQGACGATAAIFRDGVHFADIPTVIDPSVNEGFRSIDGRTSPDRLLAAAAARERIADFKQLDWLRATRHAARRAGGAR